MDTKIFKKGEVIFREGDQGTCFYQITEGTAGIYLHYGQADQKKLTEMKPGQYFGEMAIIDAWPRSATVVAEEELHAIELTGNDLVDYFQKQPDRILALMNQLGDRLRQVTAEYDEVNAFIKEKQTAGAEKKEGFLARLLKYKGIAALSGKLAGYTAEDQIRQKDAGKGVEAAMQVKSFSRNQIIFREGDEGTYLYQIHGGSVGIYSNYGTPKQVKLTTLYTNAFFGEMALVGNDPRSATAVVEEDDTMLECIRAEDLEALFRINPMKVDMILGHLSNRLRRLSLDYAKACATAAEDA
ncbi:MAG: cyclic nucleotide-binding domain-containing protein [Clostridia bacterium]|nr:cyclic nucleotide-binding domain-containing protein [Clostridia bacterium]